MTDAPAPSQRRNRGDGGLHWDGRRERWIATVTVGYDGRGKRITRKASAKTKTAAKNKLREILRDHEDGLTVAPGGYTVADAVKDWLTYGLSSAAPGTVEKNRIYAKKHVIPALGARKLRELTADDVDQWLAGKAKHLSTDTLRQIRSILRRSVARAQARDKVKRNVVMLCDVPKGQPGRPSKSLTLDQARAVLAAADRANVRTSAYIVLSLLTGMRTEEMRGLIWPYVVAYDEGHQAWVSVAEAGWDHADFAVYVWRSERVTGDTKTKKSRRTLKLPQRCVEALRALWEVQGGRRGSSLVFATKNGTPLNPANVRRDFRKVVDAAGLNGKEWTPRELRHSFVSVLSAGEVELKEISLLVGHSGTGVTEKVYRQEIRPALLKGAEAMDRIFPADGNRLDDRQRAADPSAQS
jgi:integrase